MTMGIGNLVTGAWALVSDPWRIFQVLLTDVLRLEGIIFSAMLLSVRYMYHNRSLAALFRVLIGLYVIYVGLTVFYIPFKTYYQREETDWQKMIADHMDICRSKVGKPQSSKSLKHCLDLKDTLASRPFDRALEMVVEEMPGRLLSLAPSFLIILGMCLLVHLILNIVSPFIWARRRRTAQFRTQALKETYAHMDAASYSTLHDD